jgi:uncharacterized protein
MWRLMSMTLAVILGLGVAGNVMEPSWTPEAYVAPAAYRDVQPAVPVRPTAAHADVIRESVRVDLDTETVDALVYAPPGSGRHPAVLMLHGAGTKKSTAFAAQAEHLARSGVVVMVMDKRAAGYSAWHRDFDAMAGDAIAGVELLRQRDDVHPDRIGLFGESEGTWVAPVAAAKNSTIAFLVLVSAPIVSPAQQATYATLTAFDGLDVPEPVNRAVAKGIGTALSLPGVLDYADFDVRPWLARTVQPILLVFGTDDPALPVIEAAELTRNTAGGPVTLQYFGGSQHGIRMGSSTGPFAPGYLDTLASWIGQQPDADAPARPDPTGGQPVQAIAAHAAPPSPWYATAYAHLAVLGLGLAGYAAGPVAVAVRRGARSRGAGPAISRGRRRSLQRVRILGLASLVGLVAYFVGLSHLALNQLTSPLLIYGVWTLVWIVTAGAVMALLSLWLGDTWRNPDRGRPSSAAEFDPMADGQVGPAVVPRLTTVETVALAGTVAGTVAFLLVVTYWGVFLGI